jgi:hypothetical protein
MTTATNPSGKRADGSHWQSDKEQCVRGHDLRAEIDGQPNPNVRRHPTSGTRQCAECQRLRARLMVRLQTALRWWEEHAKECKTCPRGRFCAHGRQLRKIVHSRTRAVSEAGFDSHLLVGL